VHDLELSNVEPLIQSMALGFIDSMSKKPLLTEHLSPDPLTKSLTYVHPYVRILSLSTLSRSFQ